MANITFNLFYEGLLCMRQVHLLGELVFLWLEYLGLKIYGGGNYR